MHPQLPPAVTVPPVLSLIAFHWVADIASVAVTFIVSDASVPRVEVLPDNKTEFPALTSNCTSTRSLE